MLSEVTVMECTNSIAGGYGGRLLSLMGATVERVRCVEESKEDGPWYDFEPADPSVETYLAVGKPARRIASGEALLALLDDTERRPDILVADSGGLAGFGLVPDQLRDVTESVIVGVVTPYGVTGPRSDFVATELTTFHGGGEGSLLPSGMAWELFPDRSPIKAGGFVGSYQTGVTLALAIVGALIAREDHGSGEFIDVSAQEAQVALSNLPLQRYQDGHLETRATRQHTYNGVVPCTDGFVELLTLEQHQWDAHVRVMGNPEWAAEFSDAIGRGKRGQEINEHVREWSSTKTRAEIVEAARLEGLPVGSYDEPAEVLSKMESSNAELLIDYPDGGVAGAPVRAPGLPFKVREKADSVTVRSEKAK